MHRTARRRRRTTAAAAALLSCLLLAACGGASSLHTLSKGASNPLSSLGKAAQNHVYHHALSRYAGCLRSHGVEVPNPAAAASKLDLQGIDKAGRAFKHAATSCAGTLDQALRTAAAKAYAGKGSGKG